MMEDEEGVRQPPIPFRKELIGPRHQAAQSEPCGDKGPFVPPSPGGREELGPGGRRPLAPRGRGGAGKWGPRPWEARGLRAGLAAQRVQKPEHPSEYRGGEDCASGEQGTQGDKCTGLHSGPQSICKG